MKRLVILLAACGAEPAEPAHDAVPCDEPDWWARSVRAETHPIEVHYPDGVADARAREVAALLDGYWTIQVDELEFRAPLEGAPCGSDGAVDVFLWPGQEEAYVEAIADAPATPENDWSTILVLDPEGEYGGELLPSTLAHELNHMCQAADDWDEAIAIFEATATNVETRLVPGDVRAVVAADFQAHPEWSPDHDDGYQTWFMYGAALYLEVLRTVYFDDHESFPGTLWRRMRDRDWADAVRDAVQPATFEDTIVALATWRWYTGANDDGLHLADAGELAAPPATAVELGAPFVALGPIEPLGAAYLVLDGDATASADHADVRVVEVAPQVLAAIYLPPGYDPDERPAPVSFTLTFDWP